MREIAGSDYDELEKAEQNFIISQNPSLVRCSCGNLMEVVEGQIDMNQKDDKG